MKSLLAITLVLLMFSCARKEGEVLDKGLQHIEINGNKYKFIKIRPADDADGVWLLIPDDATLKLPQVTAYSYQKKSGKSHTTVRIEAILVES